MLLTDANVVKLNELEQSIIAKMPLHEPHAAHILVELSPQDFVQWSSESPVGFIFALDIVLSAFRGTRKQQYGQSLAFLTFLRKSLQALHFMEAEIEKCITQCE